MITELSPQTGEAFSTTAGSHHKRLKLMESQMSQDWEAFARFLSRVHQSHRHLRVEFQSRAAKMDKVSLYITRAAWRSKGHTLCRHGTFFQVSPSGFQCPCTISEPSYEVLWAHAKVMPHIDNNLRSIVTVPYEPTQWQRRILRNQMRHQDVVGSLAPAS